MVVLFGLHYLVVILFSDFVHFVGLKVYLGIIRDYLGIIRDYLGIIRDYLGIIPIT